MAVNPDKTARTIMTLPRELVRQIDEYRRTLEPIPTKAEAIRQLLMAGLDAKMAPPKAGRRSST